MNDCHAEWTRYHHIVSGLANVKSYVVEEDANAHIKEYYWSKIKVVGPNGYYNLDDYSYQATIGDYDLDCKCGYGYTPDEAKAELMEKMGF